MKKLYVQFVKDAVKQNLYSFVTDKMGRLQTPMDQVILQLKQKELLKMGG